ncbi:glycosyltransferase family 69 protein [Hypoxylon sp. NC1633]|nr:glycosyltransferase family 69 protein [Hypoxylon sp. NC1633]
MADILELVHQRIFQSADMTCAMDWTFVGRDPTFYDVWVSRTLQRDLFFDIPADARLSHSFGASPVLASRDEDSDEASSSENKTEEEKLTFRGPLDGECYAGEPTLFCKDLWRMGRGRVAVVPSVNLEYSDEAVAKIKALKRDTSRWTVQENTEAARIQWVDTPPDMIKYMPGLGDMNWRPWNETFT